VPPWSWPATAQSASLLIVPLSYRGNPPRGAIKPPVHLLARLEIWMTLFRDIHVLTGSGITSLPSRPGLDGKGTKATQLHSTAPGQGGGYLIEDSVDGLFDVLGEKMRILLG
jgi:hypothetical protein